MSGRRTYVDWVGRLRVTADVTVMTAPMRCKGCGHVHDSAKVTVTARYADCSMWRCPKCNRLLDDRPGVGGAERVER